MKQPEIKAVAKPEIKTVPQPEQLTEVKTAADDTAKPAGKDATASITVPGEVAVSPPIDQLPPVEQLPLYHYRLRN